MLHFVPKNKFVALMSSGLSLRETHSRFMRLHLNISQKCTWISKKKSRQKKVNRSIMTISVYVKKKIFYFCTIFPMCLLLLFLKKKKWFLLFRNVRLHNLLFAVAIDLIVHHIRDILLPNGLLRNNINQLENHSHSSDDEALFNTHH